MLRSEFSTEQTYELHLLPPGATGTDVSLGAVHPWTERGRGRGPIEKLAEMNAQPTDNALLRSLIDNLCLESRPVMGTF